MSTETTTVTIGEATTVTVSANTGPRGPAGADGVGGGVTDGDKGDITVSASGATWTIDNNSVTLAKLADIATASILGRTTAATGDPEVLTAAQVRTLLNVEDGATADQSAAEILTAIKTVDGTGSGLDADTVDGVEAAALAPLASPTFTGVPAAPTAAAGTNSTQIATTAYVDNATSPLVAKATFPVLLTYAISDETTALTTGTAKLTVRAPFAFTLTGVRASLNTASSSGNPTFDINEGGTSVLSTKLSVDSGEKTSTTAATAAVISDSAIADDAELTFDIDTAGTGAAGAKITLIGTRVVA